jgi:hypothetical protein
VNFQLSMQRTTGHISHTGNYLAYLFEHLKINGEHFGYGEDLGVYIVHQSLPIALYLPVISSALHIRAASGITDHTGIR